MQLAIQSIPMHMVDVAQYFEKSGGVEKAARLYAKAGRIGKAMELCFKSGDTLLLESIASQLDPTQNGELLEKASIYLSKNGSPETALKLLILSNKYEEVLDICESQSITITESLYASIDLSSFANFDSKALHIRIADICLKQGGYSMACKSYTMVI